MLDRVVNTLLSTKIPNPDRCGEILELYIKEEAFGLRNLDANASTCKVEKLVLRAAEWSDGRLYWVFDHLTT